MPTEQTTSSPEHPIRAERGQRRSARAGADPSLRNAVLGVLCVIAVFAALGLLY